MAIDRDCWILGNGFFYFVLSCTDVSLLFSPIVWISAGGKLKVMAYLIEESFFLYILAQNWSNGDEFSWACGGVEEEWVSLVEEARWSFQKNRSWEGFLTRLKPTVKDMMRRGITFSMEY